MPPRGIALLVVRFHLVSLDLAPLHPPFSYRMLPSLESRTILRLLDNGTQPVLHLVDSHVLFTWPPVPPSRDKVHAPLHDHDHLYRLPSLLMLASLNIPLSTTDVRHAYSQMSLWIP